MEKLPPIFEGISKERETKIISLKELEALIHEKERPRKRILLVDGNGITYGQDTQYRFEGSGITPFGLARLCGYLEKFGVETSLIRLADYQGEDKRKELDELVASHEIIGVSTLSTDIDSTFDFCREVKARFPEKMTVGGAEHLALDDEWILSHPELAGIDTTCNGEGEIPMLALALGVPKEQIGALSYECESQIIRNKDYGRMTQKKGAISELLQVVPAKPLPKEWLKMIFPEMKRSFRYCGSAQTGSGCPFACEFCTNGPFLGAKYESLLETAEQEIAALREQGVDFVFIRDAILNSNAKHLAAFTEFMRGFNEGQEHPLGWFAFMAAIKGEQHRAFDKIAEAGCVMIGVGVEDVIGNRKALGKGADAPAAIEFIDAAKEHVLVRTLLIMGLPDHYRFSRDEIKDALLGFMKAHPQGIFRLNQWTPLVGTEDFTKFHDALLVDPREDIRAFRLFDTMHNVVSADVMYEKMGTPQSKRWVKDPSDWSTLKNEILSEYLQSDEHQQFLDSLKDKTNLGRKGLLYDIASDFRADILQNEK